MLLAVRIFLPFAAGYFVSYFYRVVNAAIAADLSRDMGLAAGDLGLLTGAYFLSFAAFQLPLGLLLDRFGARRTEAALLLFAAGGAALFATAEALPALLVGRALIGLGVSACLMAAFKAFVAWFPRERLPLINGCQFAAGGLGALAATAPVQAAVALIHWRGVFLVLAGLTLVVALAIWLAVPEKKPDGGRPPDARALLLGSLSVFTSPLFLRAAPITVASQATFLAIQGLWTGPWLRDVAGLAPPDVARHLLWIALAMTAGFVTLGGMATRLSRIGIPPMTLAIGAMVAFLLSQLPIVLQWTALGLPAWIAFGFFGTAGSLPYAALSQRFPAALAGRLNTALNMLVFVGAFAAQWGIGWILQGWPGTTATAYAADGYAAAFALMMLLQALGLGWFLLYRPTPQPEPDRKP